MGTKTSAKLEGSALVFAALGDETRLRLVTSLSDQGPLSIKQLASGFDMSRQAITKHLRVMEDAGLVRGRREGREHVWELEKKRLEIAQRFLDQISDRWDQALDRLQKLVEE